MASSAGYSAFDDAPLTTSLVRGSKAAKKHESSHGMTEAQRAMLESYESMDYDVNENSIYQAYVSTRTRKNRRNISAGRWIVVLSVAVCTALAAFFIDSIVLQLNKLKFLWTFGLFDATNPSFQFAPFIVYIVFNAVLVLIASILVVVVEPAAGGSGIPEIKCYLNGVRVPRIVRFKTLIVKVVGVLFSVAGGLEVGKEGPMIHSGSIIAAGLSQGKSTSMKFDACKCLRPYRLDHEKRDFISSGAAAGVAAAFGAPIGGVLFALEEGASFWNQSLTWRTFFGAMLSTFTLNFLLSGTKLNRWGFLSNPGLVDFGTFTSSEFVVWEIPFFILLGIIGGLLGAIFNGINQKLTMFRMRRVNKWKPRRISEAVGVAVTTALCSYLIPYLVHECRFSDASVNLETPVNSPFYCPVGTYNDMAVLFFTTLELSIKNLFHSRSPFSIGTLAVFFLLFFFIACWTYGIGVPSGLFVPSFLAGAAYGRILGHQMVSWFPYSSIEPGAYALVGAASMLAGMARMTISLTVIVIEATNDIAFGMPLMMTIMASKLTGDVFNHGLYDIHIELKYVPLLEWEAPAGMEVLTARDIMKTDLKVVRHIERVGNIAALLRNTKHNGFPVLDTGKDGLQQTFVGMMLRSELCLLLQRRVFSSNPDGSSPLNQVTYEDFQSTYPTWPKIEHIPLTPDDEDMVIDLRPYMNPAPYIVTPPCSLRRTFQLFRSMGLRHMCVVDRHHFVVGIITRKDLTHYVLHETFHHHGEHAMHQVLAGDGEHHANDDPYDDHHL